MKFAIVTLPLAAAVVLVGACSSNDDSTDTENSSSSGEPVTTDAGSDSASSSCFADGEAVVEDDSQTCCAGLYKGCTGLALNDLPPCVCSKVECGTDVDQPPPGVPCCSDYSGRCSFPTSEPFATCTCSAR